jgi:hypothetical protein
MEKLAKTVPEDAPDAEAKAPAIDDWELSWAEPPLGWLWPRLPPMPPSGLGLVEPTSVTSDFSSRYIGFPTFVSPRVASRSSKVISDYFFITMPTLQLVRRDDAYGPTLCLYVCTIFLLSVETAVEASIIHAKR